MDANVEESFVSVGRGYESRTEPGRATVLVHARCNVSDDKNCRVMAFHKFGIIECRGEAKAVMLCVATICL